MKIEATAETQEILAKLETQAEANRAAGKISFDNGFADSFYVTPTLNVTAESIRCRGSKIITRWYVNQQPASKLKAIAAIQQLGGFAQVQP